MLPKGFVSGTGDWFWEMVIFESRTLKIASKIFIKLTSKIKQIVTVEFTICGFHYFHLTSQKVSIILSGCNKAYLQKYVTIFFFFLVKSSFSFSSPISCACVMCKRLVIY